MTMNLRSLWFGSMVLIAACGGDREVSTSRAVTPDVVVAPVAPPPAVVVAPAPVQELPAAPVVAAELVVPATYAECVALGKALAGKGEHVAARTVLAAAAKLDRTRAEPQIELARSYIATGERALAVRAATKATQLAPDSSHAWNTRGRAELLRHAYEAAIAAFTRAVELDDDNVWAWNNLGFTYLQQKDYDQAITALVEATAKPNATGYMFNNLGTAYEHRDQLDEARDAFDEGAGRGSVAAKRSRERLEGVDTIVARTYDVDDRMPDVPEAAEDSEDSEEEAPAPVEVAPPVDGGVPVT